MELLILRHGEALGNRERRFLGVTDTPLTEYGEETARETALTLPRAELVYHSPMLRCCRTAELLWPQAEKRVIDDLRETDFGPFEGKNHRELQDDPLYQKWLETGRCPGVEPPEAAADRVAHALEQVLADMRSRGLERAAVVAHGGVIMALLGQFGRPERPYYEWMCPNCGGYRMAVEPGPVLRWLEDLGPEREHYRKLS